MLGFFSSSAKEFQSSGLNTAKLRGPIRTVRVQGTVKSPRAADRRWQLYWFEPTGVSMLDRYGGVADRMTSLGHIYPITANCLKKCIMCEIVRINQIYRQFHLMNCSFARITSFLLRTSSSWIACYKQEINCMNNWISYILAHKIETCDLFENMWEEKHVWICGYKTWRIQNMCE